jgi:ABC-type Fe3+ transport system permease subunit
MRSHSDFLGGFLIVVTLFFFVWRTWVSLHSGRWSVRGGVFYRAESPKMFWYLTAAACAAIFLSMLAVLLALNHHIFCHATGTPGECLAQFFRQLMGS